jgi:hypothetical protein
MILNLIKIFSNGMIAIHLLKNTEWSGKKRAVIIFHFHIKIYK